MYSCFLASTFSKNSVIQKDNLKKEIVALTSNKISKIHDDPISFYDNHRVYTRNETESARAQPRLDFYFSLWAKVQSENFIYSQIVNRK